MNFINGEFDTVQVEDSSEYKDNYESNTSWLARKLALFHSLKYLIHVHQQIDLRKKQGQSGIVTENLIQIK